jgi:hypothetical protein
MLKNPYNKFLYDEEDLPIQTFTGQKAKEAGCRARRLQITTALPTDGKKKISRSCDGCLDFLLRNFFNFMCIYFTISPEMAKDIL